MATHERFDLRSLYLYLVCLIALVIAIFAAVNLVRSTVELLYPDPGYYGYVAVPTKDPAVDAAEQQRLQDAALNSQRRQAVLSVVGSATTLVIAIPVYAYHWRRIQRERQHPEQSVAAAE